MCDQLRAFEVGCYGNGVIQTPSIDRLAAEGVRLETAVTNYPVCMAARSVLLSGQYNRTCTGGVSNICFAGNPGNFNAPEYPVFGRPHLKQPTLAELLKHQGYTTAAIGKWHIHSWPHEVGFDYFLIPRVHHCHTGQSYTENGGPEFVPAGFSVDFEAERVARFLEEQRGKKRPFFLYYNLSPPHCPFADAPPEYLSRYRPEAVPIRPNVNLDQPLLDQDYWFKVYRWDFRYYNLHLPHTKVLPEGYSLRHLIAEYYGVTTWMDAAVGRMLRVLEVTQQAEDTIVVFTSDHGDNLGSHGLVQKGGPNEEAIRIPLIIRWPAVLNRGSVARQTVASLVDLAPTLLTLAGVTRPAHFQGRDLTPALAGKSGPDDESCAFIETVGGMAIRSLTHLYYLPTDEKKSVQFFDLVSDPYEMTNLANDSSTRSTAQTLDRRLREWDGTVPWMPGPCIPREPAAAITATKPKH